jgi:hypothetical protein
VTLSSNLPTHPAAHSFLTEHFYAGGCKQSLVRTGDRSLHAITLHQPLEVQSYLNSSSKW